MREVVCAIDLGTTGCRALLVQPDGVVVAEHYVEYGSRYGAGGAVEQEAAEWWRVCVACLAEVRRAAPPAAVCALGLSAQGHSWVLLDDRLRPLRPALCWLDTRSAPHCDEVLRRVGADRLGALTGKLPGAWHLLPQLLLLRELDPAAVAGASWYAMCLDFVAAKLTGNCVTEPTTAAGSLLFDIARREWSAELLNHFDVPADKLPPVVPSGSVVGELSTDAAAATGLPAGVPVVLGGQDQKCAALGAGIRSGVATASLGTSTAVTVLADAPGFDAATKIPCFPFVLDRVWEWEAPLATTGGALRWLRDVLARDTDYAEMDRLAAESPPGANGVTFHPHLAGAASPHWQPERRARFTGLTLGTSTADVIRAVMEGVAYEIRLNVDALERLVGRLDSVHVFGGGARSRVWCELIAAVLDRPVQTVQRVETAALGAAMLAAVHGFGNDLAEAQAALLPPGETLAPSRADAAAYDALLLRYLAE